MKRGREMNPHSRGGVLLIHGDHLLLVEEELKRIVEEISKKVDLEFNLDVFRAGEDRLEDALQAAETIPFASGWRYVVVKEAQRLTPAEVKRLSRFMEDPPESSTVILAAVGLRADAPLMKAVRKAGREKKVQLSRSEIPVWIKKRFQSRGLKVDGKAVNYLREALGEDLMAIEGAVEKVSLFHQGGGKVELDEVVSLVSPTAESNVFELVDRVAVGDVDQALKIMRRLIKQGERPQAVLGFIARYLRQLLAYHALREERRPEGEMITYLGLQGKEWLLGKRLRPHGARFGEERLRVSLSLIVGLETGIRSGRLDEEEALVMAVTAIATGEELRAERPRAWGGGLPAF